MTGIAAATGSGGFGVSFVALSEEDDADAMIGYLSNEKESLSFNLTLGNDAFRWLW